MNILSPVSDIMTTDVISLDPSASIAEGARIFEENKIHHIPIVDGDVLIGIVSKSDYLFFRRGFVKGQNDRDIEEIRMRNYKISHIMTKGIAKLEPTDKINVALEVFKENMFHAIPIVDNGKLVGILTTYDIIKQLADKKQAVAKYEL